MKQSKAMSFLESLINIAVGLSVAMVANAIILPALGFPITFQDNAIIAAFMTVVSICRSFALRRLFEALHIRRPLSPAMLAVSAERNRQEHVEGWDRHHDDDHERGQLALAGAAYLVSFAGHPKLATQLWPWDGEFWKPDLSRPRRDLIRGCALGVAEIDKLDRTKKRGQ